MPDSMVKDKSVKQEGYNGEQIFNKVDEMATIVKAISIHTLNAWENNLTLLLYFI